MEAEALYQYFARIEREYQLDPQQFLDLFAAQGHRCPVCRRALVLFSSDAAEAPVVDHDHQTGEVRGLLCRGCNVAVGFIEKDRVRTRRALGYLKRTKSRGGPKGPPMWLIQHHAKKFLDSGQPDD